MFQNLTDEDHCQNTVALRFCPGTVYMATSTMSIVGEEGPAYRKVSCPPFTHQWVEKKASLLMAV